MNLRNVQRPTNQQQHLQILAPRSTSFFLLLLTTRYLPCWFLSIRTIHRVRTLHCFHRATAFETVVMDRARCQHALSGAHVVSSRYSRTIRTMRIARTIFAISEGLESKTWLMSRSYARLAARASSVTGAEGVSMTRDRGGDSG